MAELAQGKESAQSVEGKKKPSLAQPASWSDIPQQPPALPSRKGSSGGLAGGHHHSDRTGRAETYSVSTGTSEARRWLAHWIR